MRERLDGTFFLRRFSLLKTITPRKRKHAFVCALAGFASCRVLKWKKEIGEKIEQNDDDDDDKSDSPTSNQLVPTRGSFCVGDVTSWKSWLYI